MKQLFTVGFTALIFMHTNAQNSPCGTTAEEILSGEDGSLFRAEYESYKPDVDLLLKTDFEGTEAKVVLGTWCGDSRREVPRFMKIAESLPQKIYSVTYYLVDREKYCPDPAVQALKVPYVPTFIFFRQGREIGRIVETPEKSLEEDMRHILGSSDR